MLHIPQTETVWMPSVFYRGLVLYLNVFYLTDLSAFHNHIQTVSGTLLSQIIQSVLQSLRHQVLTAARPV